MSSPRPVDVGWVSARLHQGSVDPIGGIAIAFFVESEGTVCGPLYLSRERRYYGASRGRKTRVGAIVAVRVRFGGRRLFDVFWGISDLGGMKCDGAYPRGGHENATYTPPTLCPVIVLGIFFGLFFVASVRGRKRCEYLAWMGNT